MGTWHFGQRPGVHKVHGYTGIQSPGAGARADHRRGCRCCWELVDAGTWANSVVWLKPGGAYTAIRDDKVYTIKPDRDEGLWELQIVTVVMPEHLAALRSLKKKEELVSALELLDGPDTTATTIEACPAAHCCHLNESAAHPGLWVLHNVARSSSTVDTSLCACLWEGSV